MSSPAGSGRAADDDLFVLTVLGFLSLGALSAAALTWWSQAVVWLVAHRVLVPAAARPPLALPHSGGAGLDVPRLALALAAVLLFGVAVVGAVRRRLRGGELQ